MRRALAAGAVALALASAAGATSAADPGITGTSILLGATVPLTGEAAAFGSVAPGARAYFDYVNSKGGVNGRKIDFRYDDDGYNPANTVQVTHKYVEQDHAFALVGGLGTEPQTAVRQYLNDNKVPQLFVADGSSQHATTPPWC
jgi:ABC-type branched-subunit amino acid transport system substrate-binding protein